jgi:hypothetical protein
MTSWGGPRRGLPTLAQGKAAEPVAQSAESSTVVLEDPPHPWLGSSPLLDLEDSKLRLRVHALTQFAKNEREKALVIHGFVKRVPLARPFKLRAHSARQVLDAGRGDANDKSTLLVAMLRMAKLPARIRYLTLHGEILHGLVSPGMPQAMRPLVEVWLNDRWVRTDTHIFDASYMAAARQRLKDGNREWGYGIHVVGAMTWNGQDDAYVGGSPDPGDNPMVLADLGVYHDPQDFLSSRSYAVRHLRVARMLYWNAVAPLAQWSIRRLRQPQAHPVPGRRPS